MEEQLLDESLKFEVQILKVLDQYGLEIAIPSPNDSTRTSYVMISRGNSRFVHGVRIPIAELRSSAELLSEQKNAKESEPCLAKSKTSTQETGAASDPSSRKLDADPVSFSPSPVYYTRRTIPSKERKWKIIPAYSSYGRGSLPTAISKMITRLD